jgi:uncharacterized membrane protein YhaH (DUF805 family)
MQVSAGMQPLALFFSARGRLAPKPFARAVIAVYLTAFVSQLLVSPPVIAHAGPAPFALVQALSTWCWFCLHAKRLRDSGRGVGAASAIVVLYGLAVVLFLLTVALIAEPIAKDATNAPSTDLADFFILFLLVAMLTGDSNLGLFAYVVMAVLMLILMPILIAIGFSIFAFDRPSITHAPASPAPATPS